MTIVQCYLQNVLLDHHSKKVLLSKSADKVHYIKLKFKQISNTWALRCYQPSAYGEQIHLFLSKATLNETNDSRLKWSKFLQGKIHVHEIPGNHNTITGYDNTPINESHIMGLAKKLRICIDEAITFNHK